MSFDREANEARRKRIGYIALLNSAFTNLPGVASVKVNVTPQDIVVNVFMTNFNDSISLSHVYKKEMSLREKHLDIIFDLNVLPAKLD